MRIGFSYPKIHGRNDSLDAQPLKGVIACGGKVGQFRAQMEEVQQRKRFRLNGWAKSVHLRKGVSRSMLPRIEDWDVVMTCRISFWKNPTIDGTSTTKSSAWGRPKSIKPPFDESKRYESYHENVGFLAIR